MIGRIALRLAISASVVLPASAMAAGISDPASQACIANMPPIMHAVVHVESSYNPYAIGVVHGRLVRQPRSFAEGVATALYLARVGRNFSLGLAQVNRHNLERFGLDYASVFDPCANINAGFQILSACYAQAHGRIDGALSCYYSGSLTGGLGYARRVLDVAYGRSGPRNHVSSGRIAASPVRLAAMSNSASTGIRIDAGEFNRGPGETATGLVF